MNRSCLPLALFAATAVALVACGGAIASTSSGPDPGTDFMEIVGVDRRWSTGTSCSAGDKERCVSDLAALESGGVGPRIDFGVSPLSGAPMESDAFFSATVIVTQGDQARALTQAELGKQLAREDNPSGFLWPAPNAILWAAASGFAIDCPTPRMANEYEQWYLDVWACGGEGSHVLVKRHLAIQGAAPSLER